jgi:hypothetical protein
MKLTSLGLLSLAGFLALAAQSSAQSLNIDINSTYGVPASTFAAAGLAGTWNLVPPTGTTPNPLVDLAGAATSATMTYGGGSGGAFSFDNLATTGNDQALLDDAQDPVIPPAVWTIGNLQAGTYTVYTYGWAPDSNLYRTGISVNGGPVTSVGGTFAGTYSAGLTHAVDNNVVVAAGGSITITITIVTSYATFNGVQIVNNAPPPPALTPFCFGDGTGTACPCGNSGAAGNGCASSVNAAGGNLAGSGAASISNDTLSLNGSGMPNSSALYFQGTTQVGGGTGAAFGDGLRCAGGSVIRLGTKTNVAGASSYPSGSTPISVKGNNAAGNTRTYQCWYRNAAVFCNPETFNLTNGGQVTWAP